MIYFFFSGFFIVLSAVFLFRRKKKQDKVERMLSAKNISIASVIEAFKKSSNHLPGEFKKGIEIEGTVASEKFLKAPFSGQKAVYFMLRLEQEYQMEEAFTNQSGERSKKWVNKSDLIYEKEKYVPFSLKDENGKINVALEGSEITPDVSYSSYEKNSIYTIPERIQESEEVFNDLVELQNELEDKNKDKTILGYKLTEYILPVDQKLYALGAAFERDGEIFVGRGQKQPFVVSVNSSEKIYSRLEQRILQFFIAAILLFLISLVLFFYGMSEVM